jgi:ABC-2 type transport system ATP-binding protein
VSVDAAFFKKLSPMENLLFAARLYGIDAGHARRETVAICERLGVAKKRLSRPVEQMSRGMQQKVAIARALLTSPALLLLDEPTTGLDPRSKLDVQSFIEDIRTSHDASIVLTTHDLDEADRLCERIAVLDNGRAVVQDTPEGLKRLVAAQGLPATLHAVFMTYTGRSLDEDVEEDGSEDTDD